MIEEAKINKISKRDFENEGGVKRLQKIKKPHFFTSFLQIIQKNNPFAIVHMTYRKAYSGPVILRKPVIGISALV